MSNIMQFLIDTTEKFFQENIQTPILNSGLIDDSQVNNFTTKDYVSAIVIKNAPIGNVVISMDESLAKFVLHKYLKSNITIEEEEKYLEDIVMEVLNTLIGNSTRVFAETGNPITFTIPAPFKEDVAKMKKNNHSIWQWKFKTNYGSLRLSAIYNN
jgi:CheY-specific phosphatase CheX